MSRAAVAALLALVLAPSAAAQITPVSPFTGTYKEEFETLSSGNACLPGRAFSNHGDVCTPAGNYCLVTFGWLLYCAIYAHNGSDGMFGSAFGPTDYTFDVPAQTFGGYFGTNGYLAGGHAEFYGVNGALLANLPIDAPKCDWAWNGWDAGAGPRIKHVLVYANDPYNGGGLLQMDDMQLVPGATWADLAHAKAGSNGVPTLSGNGTLAAGSSDSVALAHGAGNSAVTLVYGLSTLNAPFKGGTLVPQPLGFVALTTSAGGNATLPFVFPAGVPSGTALVFQAWVHDTGATHGLSSSNGLLGTTP
jgi:hypothetical protein